MRENREILAKDYRDRLSPGLAVAAAQKSKEKTYWLNKLAGKLEKTIFPYDNKMIDPGDKPAEQTFAREKFQLPDQVFSRLLEMSSGSDQRLHMILVAALDTLLMRHIYNHDIIIGTTVVKPAHAVEDAKLINTVLALRNQPEDQMTFKEFILQVKQTVMEAAENRNYPFEILLDQLNLTGLEDESPLFGIGVVVENIHHLRYFRTVKPGMILSFLRTPGYGEGTFYYQPHLYKKTTIRRIINQYKTLLSDALFNVHLKLSEINILPAREKRQILFEFNHTQKEINRDKCYHQVFEEKVPGNVGKKAAANHLDQITYDVLNREANPIAYFLMENGVKANDLVVIYMKRSLKMLAAIIGIFKAGSAYLAIDVDYPAKRVIDILQDCEAKILITARENHGLIHNLKEKRQLTHLQTILCLDHRKSSTQTHPLENYPITNPGLHFSSDNLAYVIYTSGTTGKPKGVMIHQLGMLNHIHANIDFLSITRRDIIAQTASPCFDISVWQFLTAFTLGGITFIINKELIVDPLRMAGVLQRDKITILEIVPSWMSAFLEISQQQEGCPPLKDLRWMIPTGEALSVSLAGKWYRHYPGIKLVNAYGPAEASDDVTLWIVDAALLQIQNTIPIGKPLQNLHIYIMEPNLLLCPVKVAGEICIAGIGVGKGYIKAPEKTAKSFVTNPYAKEIGNSDYAILYRTGDIGYFTGDGNIEFVGRQDHQVKIRGFRIELGEIENQLQTHDNIKEVVVILREHQSGDKYLCAYMVPRENDPSKPFNAKQLKEFLSRKLPDYMIPAYFVPLERMPLTPNGKINRKALPDPELKTGEDYAAPRNPVEEKLVNIWSAVLGIEQGTIGIDADFFDLGGHSLIAITLIAKINKELNVKLPLSELFKSPTIRELSIYIQGAEEDRFISIAAAEEKEYYPLSSAQKRLYVMQQIEPDRITYNMPAILVLGGKLDRVHLENTFKKLIHRHKSLKTAFETVDDQPVQKVYDQVELEMEYYCAEPNEERQAPGARRWASTIKNFIRPFDLAKVPQVRIGLIKTKEQEHIFMTDMHHIIADGIANQVMIEELLKLYLGETLSPLRLQYKDFSQWQNQRITSGQIEKQQEYWLNEFRGKLPVLDIPTDYPRPARKKFSGSQEVFEIPPGEAAVLRELSRREHATMFMVVLTLCNILFFKLTLQEDIIIGTIDLGRRHPDLDKIIGVFVNALPLRNYPKPHQPFIEFLREVRKRTLDAFENQDYQFEDLVEKLKVERDASRNPLFDVVFSFNQASRNRTGNSTPAKGVKPGGPNLKIKPYDGEQGTQAKFDILVTGGDSGEELVLIMEYSTELFKAETIKRFIEYFKEIVSAVVTDETMQLKNVKISHDLVTAASTVYQSSQSEFDF
jgi:amino acid adenylation domain-containing protein